MDSLGGAGSRSARCGVSKRFCPMNRLSTPAAVRPVVSSVRSTGYVGLPVRNIFSMLFTSGLKKFASVVRPAGMGRYICVENGSLAAVDARGEVEILHQAAHQQHGALQPVGVLVAVGDGILAPAAACRRRGKIVVEAFARRASACGCGTARPPSAPRGQTPSSMRLPEIVAAIGLHPLHAGLAALAPLHHALDRFERVEIVAVDAAVADAHRLADPRAERHLDATASATSPAGSSRP